MLIDGKLVGGFETAPVIDPATEEVVAQAPVASPAQLEEAVQAAKAAFHKWKQTELAQRVEIIHRIADAVEARRDEIARVITLEVGKPIAAARADVDLSLQWARYVAMADLKPTILQDDEQAYVEVRRKPIGVVATIVPWNFPFFQTMYKVIPALLTGNTVVVKPAPTSPLNALILGEILQSIVPPGVVNILGDGGDLGPLLSGHPDIGKVSFTGSTAAGRQVMASGAPTLKRIVLELGGNDAAVVMDDADLDEATRGIFTWAFTNSGQVCINIKRIYVPEGMYDQFCDAFAKLAASAVVGHGLDEKTEFGPIQNRRQFETVKDCLAIAKRDGTIIAGGQPLPGKGYFVPPTVVRDVAKDSRLIAEETFGPIRSIIKYSTIDEVVEMVNDTQYGLGNSVWGKDVAKAAEIANRLDSGTTWINTHFVLAPNTPFGGRKQSGLGVEFGLEGIQEFTDHHVIHIART
jgi:aldehyde dehydrogenase (NAD+)